MAPLNLTFGIELEFICVYSPGSFDHLIPNAEDLIPDADGLIRAAGAAIYHSFIRAGIPATGHESLDDDYVFLAPTHSQWRIEGDVLDLSDKEHAAMEPGDYVVEDIELSSRKFDLSRDDWRAEIKAVLDILTSLEAISKGCRFITNETTGFHAHIGNGDDKIPLRAAKNLFQLATAFERCFDMLHTIPRIMYPKSDGDVMLYAPPSFFHANNGANETPAGGNKKMMYDWLCSIERRRTYEGLGSLSAIRNPEVFPFASRYLANGHYSAYNFDNLFGNTDRHESTLTKTIEFRQHTGTLDFLEIVAWVLLTSQMVKYAHEAGDVEFIALCAHGVDQDFDLRDVLSAIGCHPDVIAHYLNEDDMITGLLSDGKTAFAGSQALDEYAALLAHNDDEQTDRTSENARKIVMTVLKDYGFDSSINTVRIPIDFVARHYQQACIAAAMHENDPDEIKSRAKSVLYEFLAKLYRHEYSEEDLAKMTTEEERCVFVAGSDSLADHSDLMFDEPMQL